MQGFIHITTSKMEKLYPLLTNIHAHLGTDHLLMKVSFLTSQKINSYAATNS